MTGLLLVGLGLRGGVTKQSSSFSGVGERGGVGGVRSMGRKEARESLVMGEAPGEGGHQRGGVAVSTGELLLTRSVSKTRVTERLPGAGAEGREGRAVGEIVQWALVVLEIHFFWSAL